VSDPAPSDGPPAWRQVLALALPALAQQYLFFAIQLCDQFLARSFSASDQAALTAANYVYWLGSSYSVVVGAGASAVVGRCVGAGDFRTAVRAVGQTVLLAAVFGAVASAAGLIFLDALVSVLGLTPTAAPVAAQYLQPLLLIVPLQLIEVGGIACLVGAGDTRTGLFVLLAVAAVNLPVAAALAFGFGPIPALGFVGIAWGTALAHVAGTTIVLAILFRGRYGLKLPFAALRPDVALIARLLRVSVPAAVDSLSVSFCQFWFFALVNRLGDEATAAHGIAIRLEGMGYLAGAAFGTAATSLVSRNLGAQRPDRAARGAWTSLGFGGSIMIVMGAVFYLFAETMCAAFSPGNAGVIALGAEALRIVAFAMPALACQNVLTQALRGAGDTRVPVLISWLGFLAVRIPLTYYLTGPDVGWGLRGAWLAMFADLWLRGSLVLARFAAGTWKRMKV
jgi:putative MATE family efflux protein